MTTPTTKHDHEGGPGILAFVVVLALTIVLVMIAGSLFTYFLNIVLIAFQIHLPPLSPAQGISVLMVALMLGAAFNFRRGSD